MIGDGVVRKMLLVTSILLWSSAVSADTKTIGWHERVKVAQLSGCQVFIYATKIRMECVRRDLLSHVPRMVATGMLSKLVTPYVVEHKPDMIAATAEGDLMVALALSVFNSFHYNSIYVNGLIKTGTGIHDTLHGTIPPGEKNIIEKLRPGPWLKWRIAEENAKKYLYDLFFIVIQLLYPL
jgi:hypothetical protein